MDSNNQDYARSIQEGFLRVVRHLNNNLEEVLSTSTRAIQARSAISDSKIKFFSFRELSCLGWGTFSVFKRDLSNVAILQSGASCPVTHRDAY